MMNLFDIDSCDFWKVLPADPNNEFSKDQPTKVYSGVPCRLDTVTSRNRQAAGQGAQSTTVLGVLYIDNDGTLPVPFPIDTSFWAIINGVRWDVIYAREAKDSDSVHHWEIDVVSGVNR